MVKVKICGITNYEDARRACEYGADVLGFIFVPNTPRYVEKDKVRDIVFELKSRHGETGFSGLFKDQDLSTVVDIVSFCGLDLVQLHGSEAPEYCAELKKRLKDDHDRDIRILKVFKIEGEIMPQNGFMPNDYVDTDYFVFDTYNRDIAGGTGEQFDWGIIAGEKDKLIRPFFVAGGLTPGNVDVVVREIRPYGVDVSSGTESSPGKKDDQILKEFIKNAKEA